MPVIVVGGGAPLSGASLAGASQVLLPHHAAVANAVGAAIPQVCLQLVLSRLHIVP